MALTNIYSKCGQKCKNPIVVKTITLKPPAPINITPLTNSIILQSPYKKPLNF